MSVPSPHALQPSGGAAVHNIQFRVQTLNPKPHLAHLFIVQHTASRAVAHLRQCWAVIGLLHKYTCFVVAERES